LIMGALALGRSLVLNPLDFNQRFIDDFMTLVEKNPHG